MLFYYFFVRRNSPILYWVFTVYCLFSVAVHHVFIYIDIFLVVPLVMIIDYFIGAKRRCIWATSVLDTEYSRPKKNYIEIILWLVVLFFLTALCMWNVLIKVSVQIYWHDLNSRDLLNYLCFSIFLNIVVLTPLWNLNLPIIYYYWQEQYYILKDQRFVHSHMHKQSIHA